MQLTIFAKSTISSAVPFYDILPLMQLTRHSSEVSVDENNEQAADSRIHPDYSAIKTRSIRRDKTRKSTQLTGTIQ